jgi:hypothetical protein
MHHYVAAGLGLKGNRGGADRFAQPELCAQFYTAANRGWRRERRATRRGAVRLWVLAVLLRLGNRYGAALALWHLKGTPFVQPMGRPARIFAPESEGFNVASPGASGPSQLTLSFGTDAR